MSKTFVNWTGSIYYHKMLVLKGKVRPTIVSPEYLVEITYKAGKMPDIQVISPTLEIHPEKEKLPHVWPNSGSLCLYENEFDVKNDLLAESIIIWVTWWLYYYEIWLETGKWVAKGTHPDKW